MLEKRLYIQCSGRALIVLYIYTVYESLLTLLTFINFRLSCCLLLILSFRSSPVHQMIITPHFDVVKVPNTYTVNICQLIMYICILFVKRKGLSFEFALLSVSSRRVGLFSIILSHCS